MNAFLSLIFSFFNSTPPPLTPSNPKECRRALRRFGELMRAADIEEFLSKADEGYYNYDDFVMEFAKLLVGRSSAPVAKLV